MARREIRRLVGAAAFSHGGSNAFDLLQKFFWGEPFFSYYY